MKRRELPSLALAVLDSTLCNGAGALRLEACRPGALTLTVLDERDMGHLAPHPSRARRIVLEVGAVLDVSEVLGRIAGVRAMVLDTGKGATVPLAVAGVEGRELRIIPGRVRKAGATLALAEYGANGRPVPGTVAEVLIPTRASLALARALRRWGMEALDAGER